jgi:hypothetical protein
MVGRRPSPGRPGPHQHSAFAGQLFILSTSGCEPLIMAAARNAGIRLDVTHEARELAAIMQMVGAGRGVPAGPRW